MNACLTSCSALNQLGQETEAFRLNAGELAPAPAQGDEPLLAPAPGPVDLQIGAPAAGRAHQTHGHGGSHNQIPPVGACAAPRRQHGLQHCACRCIAPQGGGNHEVFPPAGKPE